MMTTHQGVATNSGCIEVVNEYTCFGTVIDVKL